MNTTHLQAANHKNWCHQSRARLMLAALAVITLFSAGKASALPCYLDPQPSAEFATSSNGTLTKIWLDRIGRAGFATIWKVNPQYPDQWLEVQKQRVFFMSNGWAWNSAYCGWNIDPARLNLPDGEYLLRGTRTEQGLAAGVFFDVYRGRVIRPRNVGFSPTVGDPVNCPEQAISWKWNYRAGSSRELSKAFAAAVGDDGYARSWKLNGRRFNVIAQGYHRQLGGWVKAPSMCGWSFNMQALVGAPNGAYLMGTSRGRFGPDRRAFVDVVNGRPYKPILR